MKKIVISTVVVCLMGWFAEASGATINAANCSSSAVTAAVASASDGDTVIVPAGTCTWSSSVAISKAITLQGQGVGATIVLDGVASGALLSFNLVANRASRLTGIEFRNGTRASMEYNGVIGITGLNTDSRTMRVDHCKFDHLLGPALQFETVIGVVDHNTYIGTPTSRFINVWDKLWNGGSWGDRAWSDATGFGGPNFLFIEDNVMSYGPSDYYALIDGFAGARFVLRYNTIVNGWVEAHGSDSSGRFRGTRAVEIYNNTFTSNATNKHIVDLRSAVALIHNNTASGFWGEGIFELTNYRRNQSFGPWGLADGTNPWDYNVNGRVVRALDQPCVSGGSLITGDTPALPAGWNNQVVDACYEWNNTESGRNVNFAPGFDNIVDGVHFFNDTSKPGYTPYTYPHPLTVGGSIGTSSPQPPGNLRIVSQ